MRRTKEEAEQTRKDILDSALTVFDEMGYAKASLNAIAKNAGVTRGAIYWHFENKGEILRVILKEYMQCILDECMPQNSDESISALDDIRYMLNQYIGKMLNDKGFLKYVRLVDSEVLKTNKDLNEEFFNHLRDLGFGALKILVAKGLRQNVIREDIGLEFTAFTLYATMAGAENLLVGNKCGLDFVGDEKELVENIIKLIKK